MWGDDRQHECGGTTTSTSIRVGLRFHAFPFRTRVLRCIPTSSVRNRVWVSAVHMRAWMGDVEREQMEASGMELN